MLSLARYPRACETLDLRRKCVLKEFATEGVHPVEGRTLMSSLSV